MCQAAKAIGNTELENKFSEGNFNYCFELDIELYRFLSTGISRIKRDIVFAASLYL